MNDWPFADPPDVATFTVRQIIDGTRPILLVSHDADDGGWQFLTGEALSMDDALLVALKEIVLRDPSVLLLADLPTGWQASRRDAEAQWVRELLPPEGEA